MFTEVIHATRKTIEDWVLLDVQKWSTKFIMKYFWHQSEILMLLCDSEKSLRV
jgi:hypothetical protein